MGNVKIETILNKLIIFLNDLKFEKNKNNGYDFLL